MKKLDLHIHSLPTCWDNKFEFSIKTLKKYVQEGNINGIAITNHNTFDKKDYLDIVKSMKELCVVLPGIEITMEPNGGHLICITNQNDIEDFSEKCTRVQEQLTSVGSKLELKKLLEIFPIPNKYLWIPHYDKKPEVDEEIFKALESHILCGETCSVKKFIYHIKDNESLTPVYFSDFRPTEGARFPLRQTYFDIDEINIDEIKHCLLDKHKVALTEQEGNSLFYALSDLPLSTGLNVVIGGRSSGKTYTLNQISDKNEKVKYIKQFALVEQDQDKAEVRFKEKISNQISSEIEKYFESFKQIVYSVNKISLDKDTRDVDEYIKSLVKNAKETDRNDSFAQCKLYKESLFSMNELSLLTGLIKSVEDLLDSRQYRDVIDKYLNNSSLRQLHKELVRVLRDEHMQNLKKEWVNDVVRGIVGNLKARTAATFVADIDFYKVQMNREKVKKFNEIAKLIMKEDSIYKKELEGFTIQITKRPFSGPGELKKFSGKQVMFSDIFSKYNDDPYEFLLALTEKEEISEADRYKYFSLVENKILNEFGYEVSGGERAEFNLLQEINDANNYDILLIDEPEASFDNIFLKDRVNHILKELSNNMPVVLVTHNSTVGASIKPDFIVYTKRIIENGVKFERFYGLPSSKTLKSSSGETISNFEAILDCLEAGKDAYEERRTEYEMLND